MSKKNKYLFINILFVIVLTFCSILQIEYKYGPFLGIASLFSYIVGRWEVKNGI
jgi:hypothetical protein